MDCVGNIFDTHVFLGSYCILITKARCYNVCKKKKFGLMNVKMNCMFQRLFYKNSKISPLCHFK